MNYSIKLLKDKLINNIDYEFLNSVKYKFPTNNVYFLVCLTEVIYNFESTTNDDVLDVVIKQAYDLYCKSDISSYLNGL